MENQPTPPNLNATTDGTDDAALLAAIAQHPAAAHALASIAAGADPRATLADLADELDPKAPEPPSAPRVPVSSPSFLEQIRPDFWEGI